jgi:hypothetical protein
VHRASILCADLPNQVFTGDNKRPLIENAGFGAVIVQENGMQTSASRGLTASLRTETVSEVSSATCSNDPVSTRRGLRRSTNSLQIGGGGGCGRRGRQRWEAGRQPMSLRASSPSWPRGLFERVVQLGDVFVMVARDWSHGTEREGTKDRGWTPPDAGLSIDGVCRCRDKLSKTSERHWEWFIIMTGPQEAAKRNVSNDGDVRKSSKPDKA